MPIHADYQARLDQKLDATDCESWSSCTGTAPGLPMPDYDFVTILTTNALPWWVIRRLAEHSLDTRIALANFKGSANDTAFKDGPPNLRKMLACSLRSCPSKHCDG